VKRKQKRVEGKGKGEGQGDGLNHLPIINEFNFDFTLSLFLI